MKLSLNLLMAISVAGVKACIDVKEKGFSNQPFKLWDASKGYGFKWDYKSSKPGPDGTYFDLVKADNSEDVVTLLILDNGITVEYYTYMYREQSPNPTVGYFKDGKIVNVEGKDLIADDYSMMYQLTDKGELASMVREDGNMWYVHDGGDGRATTLPEQGGILISDVCGVGTDFTATANTDESWDKPQESWDKPPSQQDFDELKKQAEQMDWNSTTSCLNWETAKLYTDDLCMAEVPDEEMQKFALENSAGPNWGTPGCHHSKNAMGTKEWYTETMCSQYQIEMRLNKDPKCEDTFEEVKITYMDSGSPMCTKFGSSGYYLMVEQNKNMQSMDATMDPSMHHDMSKDWDEKDMAKQAGQMDWENTSSCLNWQNSKIYTDPACMAEVPEEESMKFAMENHAGPNWGTPGCHHSKNAMGDKEWFTETMCMPDMVEMRLNKDPECTDTFEEVKFLYSDSGAPMCTQFGSSGYFLMVEQNWKRTDATMDPNMHHDMPKDWDENEMAKQAGQLDWQNTTSCLNWETTKLYTDDFCMAEVPEEESMKFAMENSAGPNWGTPGCHHSKNAMGTKEWFTYTDCMPDMVYMYLNKDPECKDTFESVYFYYDQGKPNCTKFGSSGYYIMIEQNNMTMNAPTMAPNMTYGNDSYSNYSDYGNGSYSNYSDYGNGSYSDYSDYGNGSYSNYSYDDYGKDHSYNGGDNEIRMDMGDLGDMQARQRGDETEFRMKGMDMEVEAKTSDEMTKFEVELPMDVEVEAKMHGDRTQVEVELPGDMKVEGNMDSEMTGVKFEGDGYEMSAMYGEKDGGQAVMTETKFDQYYMYSMDQMDSQGNSAPDCGPSAMQGEDECKKMAGGGDSCCTHVVMTDRSSGTQQSFYRCMNQKVVDMSFHVEIDGMSMAMGCTGGASSAKYLAGTAVASMATLAAMTLF